MNLCEIFRSIQGELQGIGRQALFLRTAGCNLGKKCPVDCDTRYSWDTTVGGTFFERDTDTLMNEILESGVDVVVITGGEPLLQQAEIESLMETTNACIEIDWFIETNGTIQPSDTLINASNVYFNVSPKLSTFDYEAFPLARSIFKHVITPGAKNFTAWQEKMASLSIAIQRKIYFMPASRTREQYMANAPAVANWCNEHGFNFGPREHLVIWDGKRGL
ncbi:MAG TPA: 7-carboxy-7-deazaguanine synthase QueE [Candidatus Lokiarchaeia archaeon]|nr:7-carboxy-7-deazaguanine synthase QueE [Candidatus Lokiarchaeia archaeon]